MIKRSEYVLLWFACLLQFVSCSTSNRSANTRPGPDEVTVSDVAFKSLEDYTTEGELWFSVKATVKNNMSLTKHIVVEIRGVDNEGFELEEFHLEADFAPGEVKTLSDRSFMKTKFLQTVTSWQVGEVRCSD